MKEYTIALTDQQGEVVENIADRLRCTPEEFIAGALCSGIEATFLAEDYYQSIASWLADVRHYVDDQLDLDALGTHFGVKPSPENRNVGDGEQTKAQSGLRLN